MDSTTEDIVLWGCSEGKSVEIQSRSKRALPARSASFNVTFYDSLRVHVQSFLAQIRAGQSPLVTGQDGLRGLEIIQAAIQSEKIGAAVSV